MAASTCTAMSNTSPNGSSVTRQHAFVLEAEGTIVMRNAALCLSLQLLACALGSGFLCALSINDRLLASNHSSQNINLCSLHCAA